MMTFSQIMGNRMVALSKRISKNSKNSFIILKNRRKCRDFLTFQIEAAQKYAISKHVWLGNFLHRVPQIDLICCARICNLNYVADFFLYSFADKFSGWWDSRAGHERGINEPGKKRTDDSWKPDVEVIDNTV